MAMITESSVPADPMRSPQGRLRLEVQSLLVPPPPASSDGHPWGTPSELGGDLAELAFETAPLADAPDLARELPINVASRDSETAEGSVDRSHLGAPPEIQPSDS
eukprot:8389785-Pyramimonas_sp.AAC.1